MPNFCNLSALVMDTSYRSFYYSLVSISRCGSDLLCYFLLLDLGWLLLCLQGVGLPLMPMWSHSRRVFMVMFKLLISSLLIPMKFPL